MSALSVVLWTFATCFVLALILIWRAYVAGVRAGVKAMYAEATQLLLTETERTKLRSAGLIASIDTQLAILRAIAPDRSKP